MRQGVGHTVAHTPPDPTTTVIDTPTFARAIDRLAPMALPNAAISALWIFAAALSTLAGPTAATDFGHRPATTVTQPAAAGIDPATFIPGHPDRGAAGRAVHANFDHPALATYRAGRPRIDPNTFILQPPATTTWIIMAPWMVAAVQPR